MKEDVRGTQPSTFLSIELNLWIAVILTIAILVPFLNKAFHIDDPMFLFTAKHLMNKPWDFFGSGYNWFYSEEPMHVINLNPPPVVSYFIAFVGYFFGLSEKALHVAFLLPAVALISGVYFNSFSNNRY